MSDPFADLILTAEELAELVGGSARSVHRHALEDGLPRRARGQYPIRECVQWYIRRIREDAQRAVEGDSPELDRERKRLLTAQAEKVELENEETRARLLDRELVAGVLNAVCALVATQLDALGPRTAGRLAGETDPAHVLLILRDECNAIRTAAADAIDAFATDFERVGDREAAAETDGGGMGGRLPDTAGG